MMRKWIPLLLVSVLVGLAGGGCSGGAKSARDVAGTYLDLMKAEKYEDAAKMWDYVSQARKDNEDWDSIQEGQRKLIVDKLASEKAQSLKLWSGYFPASTKIASFNETADGAEAQLEGGRATRLDLIKVEDVWKISDMQ